MEVRAKKALGQHFLTDQSIARRIVDSLSVISCEGEAGVAGDDFNASDRRSVIAGCDRQSLRDVLEIGPGMGVLTQYLLQREDIDLKAVEVDGESVDYLLTHFAGMQGRLLQADYLRLDMNRVFQGPYRIIGNFPYNISSQIFFKILEDKDRVPEVVCMIQKEVAERIAEKPGSKTYGILSVLLQAWYDIEYLFTVGPGAFAPPPKVHSAVIRLTRNARTSLGCDEKFFKTVVKTAFNQRRKTLRNALKPLLSSKAAGPSSTADSPVASPSSPAESPSSPADSPSFPAATGNLPDVSHFLDLRAERLSVEDFILLTRAIQASAL